MYGSIATNGKRFFRTYSKFNGSTFVEYLKEMHRRFGKIAVIADRASQHKSKPVKQLLRKNKEIRIIYMPKGSPYLSVVEEFWHQAKQRLLVSEQYDTFEEMCSTISEYVRTVKFDLDVKTYLYRKAVQTNELLIVTIFCVTT